MTHFLFLEKGARVRDADRASSDKAGRGATPSRRRRSEAADPGFLLLMLPSTDGYRVLRASLEEVIEIPAADLGGKGRIPDARLLERLLEAASAEIGGRPAARERR